MCYVPYICIDIHIYALVDYLGQQKHSPLILQFRCSRGHCAGCCVESGLPPGNFGVAFWMTNRLGDQLRCQRHDPSLHMYITHTAIRVLKRIDRVDPFDVVFVTSAAGPLSQKSGSCSTRHAEQPAIPAWSLWFLCIQC